jgi:hypothetical protein
MQTETWTNDDGIQEMTFAGRMAFLAVLASATFLGGLLARTEAAVDAGTKIQGEVIGQGAPCVQFRMDSGETVSLDGASPQQFKRGMKLELEGTWMRMSTCMQGRAFRVLQSKEID